MVGAPAEGEEHVGIENLVALGLIEPAHTALGGFGIFEAGMILQHALEQ